MKKHDEGYVLAYVTVVLLLFCLVASMILTGALKNLQHQQDTITRMQDQYVAAGMIEQVVAQINNGKTIDPDSFKQTDGETVIQELTITSDENDSNLTVLTARYNTVVITCVIDSHGSYISYEIGTVENGGASE